MNSPKLIDVTPFEPLIIKVHYDGFNWEKLRPVCQKMIDETKIPVDLEEDGGKSSVYNRENQPHHHPAFKDFYKWLRPIAHHIMHEEWGLAPQWEYFVGNSWVNVHTRGGITTEHHHGPCAMVIATYLNLPKDGGFIQFRDPTDIYKTFHSRPNEDDFTWRTIPAQTGDVLLFPAWLRHKTQPNGSDEERWVLTTNIMNTFRPETPGKTIWPK